MRETRIVKVNGREIPVLISDEKEALLAAKAAGRAIVGLWRPGMDMEEISVARYAVEELSDATEEFLERAVRRELGLPWRIYETKRLLIREMFGDDFDEVWGNQVGRGFGSVEELAAYTKHQYGFYEFGFWALVEKATGELIGMAGLKVPEEDAAADEKVVVMERPAAEAQAPGQGGEAEAGQAGGHMLGQGGEAEVGQVGGQAPGQGSAAETGLTLELGYHIFRNFRRQGYGRESCEAVLRYGEDRLGADRFIVRISRENTASMSLAESLGFTLI